MKQNISINDINKFAPEDFFYREDKKGVIWVEHKKNKKMNHYENVGYTSLTLEDLKDAFQPFYNFTHRMKDGKMIEDSIKVLPLGAAESEINKSINDYMRSRSYDVKLGEVHLAQKEPFDKLLENKIPSLNSYLELVDKRLDNAEEYKNNSKSRKESKYPKKTFFGFGYNKKYLEMEKSQVTLNEDKKNIEKNRHDLQDKSKKSIAELKDNYYGDLFTQMVLQSAAAAVEVDVRNHYNRLAEQHNSSEVYNKHLKVRDKLRSYGAEFGEVSGAVKADAIAEAKTNKTKYKEPTRDNKLQKAHENFIEKTFSGR